MRFRPPPRALLALCLLAVAHGSAIGLQGPSDLPPAAKQYPTATTPVQEWPADLETLELLRWLQNPPAMTLDEYLFPGETRLNYQTIVVLRILSITPDEIVLIDGTLAAIENKIPIPGHDLDRVGFRVGDQVSIVVGRLIRRWPDETLHPAAPRLGDEFAENLRQVLGAELARTISTHYVLVWHRMEARIRIPYHRERAARVVSRLGRRLPW